MSVIKQVWLIDPPLEPARKPLWRRAGYAFQNSDGSFTVHLSALPNRATVLSVRDQPQTETADKDSPESDSRVDVLTVGRGARGN